MTNEQNLDDLDEGMEEISHTIASSVSRVMEEGVRSFFLSFLFSPFLSPLAFQPSFSEPRSSTVALCFGGW